MRTARQVVLSLPLPFGKLLWYRMQRSEGLAIQVMFQLSDWYTPKFIIVVMVMPLGQWQDQNQTYTFHREQASGLCCTFLTGPKQTRRSVFSLTARKFMKSVLKVVRVPFP